MSGFYSRCARDFCLVTPIEPELLKLVLKDCAIWIRWREAFDRGEVSNETHPALLEDRPRHDELHRLIGDRLKTDPANCKKLIAEFRNIRVGWNNLEVQWSEPSH